MAAIGINVLTVDFAATHIDECAADQASNTAETKTDLRSGGVGLQRHLHGVGHRVDANRRTVLREDEFDGVVGSKVGETVAVGVGIVTAVVGFDQIHVALIVVLIVWHDFNTVDITMGHSAVWGALAIDVD